MRLAEYVDRYRAYNRNAPRRQAPALDAVKREGEIWSAVECPQ